MATALFCDLGGGMLGTCHSMLGCIPSDQHIYVQVEEHEGNRVTNCLFSVTITEYLRLGNL